MNKSMKKVLFIDRDGTIIIEPPDEQVDSLEKMEFLPGVITNLNRIANELDFELVMVTNQDGLGTNSFPEEKFWPAHNKMITTLENEDIHFSDILIDRTLPDVNASTRKPGTGLLNRFTGNNYDLAKSFVIGDRKTDIQLARNLGCKAIFIGSKPNNKADFTATGWKEIYEFLRSQERITEIKRVTRETDITFKLNLDGTGKAKINTGIGFFNHMLELFAKHSGCDIACKVKGDLDVDEHHTIEDTAIVLGEAFAETLGNKKGIDRYGFLLPMDESIAEVAVDFSGRSELIWKANFQREKIGDMPTELIYHFFKSFCDSVKCNLYIKVEGKNEHHKSEAIFKAVAKAIKMAINRNPENPQIPSTKGIL
jgi:imidazoleglycerol-phosphate dehydratase/histidinol-phosphatase